MSNAKSNAVSKRLISHQFYVELRGVVRRGVCPRKGHCPGAFVVPSAATHLRHAGKYGMAFVANVTENTTVEGF